MFVSIFTHIEVTLKATANVNPLYMIVLANKLSLVDSNRVRLSMKFIVRSNFYFY